MNQQNNDTRIPLLAQYNKTPELSASSVFKLRPEELQLFFYRNHMEMTSNTGELRECLNILRKVGYNDGLLQSVASDAKTGIIGDVKDINRRQKFFGSNTRTLPHVRGYWATLWDQLNDFFNILLFVFATISLIFALMYGEPGEHKWAESLSIYFAVVFVCFLSSICDYGKEQQFLKLQAEIVNDQCTVIRGHQGTSQTLYNRDLCVGDIILLEAGDRVPADCILIEEMDMKVDQKQYFSWQVQTQEKQCFNEKEQRARDHRRANPDPCLLQDSLIMEGSGRAVVCCVGKYTLKESELEPGELMIGEEETPMKRKLNLLGGLIGKWAIMGSVLAFLLFMVFWICNIMFAGHTALISEDSILNLINNFQIAVALLIVLIPDGLPLAISISMAFSTDNLKNDHLLMKSLGALETSGQVIDILTGKTGTLTSGDLRLEKLFLGGQEQKLVNAQVQEEITQKLYSCIILNTDARMEFFDQDQKYTPAGSPVEVGLLKYLIRNDVPVQDKMVQREVMYECVLKIPFSSDRKRMTVVYRLPTNELGDPSRPDVRIVVKGAPEVVVPLCHRQLDLTGEEEAFTGEDYLQSTVADQIAKLGMKPLTIGYRDMSLDDFKGLMERNDGFETEETRVTLEENLCLVASFGFEDNLRPGIQDSIEAFFAANTNTRIVSGDHKDCVLYLTHSLGLSKEEIEENQVAQAMKEVTNKLKRKDLKDKIPKSLVKQGIMSGEEFRALMNEMLYEVQDERDGGSMSYDFNGKDDMTDFKRIIVKNLYSLYRASPSDKHMLAAALKKSDHPCAATGESLNDALALSEANVGFAMGGGCDVAKEHSDMIILDDNYSSLLNAARWGRNMQDNCRKFITYQLTVGISCFIVVLLGGATLGMSPFSVFQLLWINLVMDVLAAIAIATETPHPTELRKQRMKENDKIVTRVMLRNICSMVLYQAIVMIVLLYATPAMFDIRYNMIHDELRENGLATNRLVHYTFLFQTFILMNLFNMFNVRKLSQEPDEKNHTEYDPEYNVFSRLHSNWWFLIIFLAELNIQYFFVGQEWLSIICRTSTLPLSMHITAFLLGLSVLGVAAIVKALPFRWSVKLFPAKIDEEVQEGDFSSRIDGMFQHSQTERLMDKKLD